MLFPRRRKKRRPEPHRRRPACEPLEDRRMLAVFTVDNTADEGAGSLRDAIAQANASAGADEIVFDTALFSTPQTILIESELPTITEQLTISGPGADLLALDGGNSDVNKAVVPSLIAIDDGTEEPIQAALSDLTIRNFWATGAVLTNNEELTLERVVFNDNRGETGIKSNVSLSIVDSHF